MRRMVCRLGMVATLLLTHGVAAETVSGVYLPEEALVDGKRLVLSSCGVRDTLWMEHYVAALYVPQGMTERAAVGNAQAPKILRVHILSAEHFPAQVPEQWREPLKKSLSAEKYSQVSQAYSKLNQGDVMTFTYTPDEGLVMKVNGETVMTTGHGVIDALLTAWKRGDNASETLSMLLKGHAC